MIKYTLRCGQAHEFEAWFNSISAFDGQKAASQLSCPLCQNTDIEKAPMAPSVVTRRTGTRTAGNGSARAGDTPASMPDPSPQNEPARPHSARETYAPVTSVPAAANVVEMMRQLRSLVEANTEDVGKRFAEEARKIHYEEAAPRGIRGEATAKDIRELDEEGITVAALPRLPEEQN